MRWNKTHMWSAMTENQKDKIGITFKEAESFIPLRKMTIRVQCSICDVVFEGNLVDGFPQKHLEHCSEGKKWAKK